MVDGKKIDIMVSVIMVTYGHEKYICEAIEGVLIQFCNFDVELIIANDCSPDRTDAVVKEYLSKVKIPSNLKINYIQHEVNKGANENFIWAKEQSSGKYIAICEGDDYWTDPLKLQKQVDFLESNSEYVACQHHREILYEDGSRKVEKSIEYVFTQCLIFKNNIDDFSLKEITTVFNADTFLEYYLKLYGRYGHLDFVGAVYRSNSTGIYSSLKQLEKNDNSVDSLKKIKNFLINSTKNETQKYLLKEVTYKLNGYVMANSSLQRDSTVSKKINYFFRNYNHINIGRSVIDSIRYIISIKKVNK